MQGWRLMPFSRRKREIEAMHQMLRSLLFAGVVLMLQSCRAVSLESTPPQSPAIESPPAVEPAPGPPSPPEPPAPALPAPVPANPLASWFRGGFSGKTVVVWGNSTVSHAAYFFQQLRLETSPGNRLDGLDPQRILNYGNNGASLAALLDGQGPYPVDAVIAAQADLLIIRGPLINDVRFGTTTLEQAIAMLRAALDRIRAGSPGTPILLTTENSLLSTDPGGFGWVQPASQAQHYTDILRAAVLAFDGVYPDVKVFDVMALEYGVTSPATSPLMANQLHPNQAGQEAEAELVVQIIGAQR